MGLERLSSIRRVARFLDVPEADVAQFLDEQRLGGVLLRALGRRGTPVTPSVKRSVDSLVKALTPKEEQPALRADREYLLASEATVTIMFTDVVGSTAMAERLGDWRARQVLREHDDIIRRQTRLHGGVEVKSMGDGFMLTFPSAHRAVACAVAAQRELADYNAEHPEGRIEVRMGLSVGEPIREEEDLFGKSVIMAARISAKAKGGQILTSHIVRALMDGASEFTFSGVGSFELKGLTGKQPMYEVFWGQS